MTISADFRNEAKEILVLTLDFPVDTYGEYCRCYLGAWIEDGKLHRDGVGSICWPSEEDSPFAPFTLYRLRVRPHQHDTGKFLLLRILQGETESPALQVVRAELMQHEAAERAAREALRESQRRKPVAFWQEDPFSVFALYEDEKIPGEGAFEAEMDWLGDPVCVVLPQCDGSKTPPPLALATLRKLRHTPERWLARLKSRACEVLLETARDWQDDTDEDGKIIPPLTAADFNRRIRLEEICCDSNGGFSAGFDDGDLFAGHMICVNVNPDGSLGDASIAG